MQPYLLGGIKETIDQCCTCRAPFRGYTTLKVPPPRKIAQREESLNQMSLNWFLLQICTNPRTQFSASKVGNSLLSGNVSSLQHDFSLITYLIKLAGATAHPIFHPVTLKVLPALPMVMVRSHMSGRVAGKDRISYNAGSAVGTKQFAIFQYF
jgi:hypothetical protein